MLSQRFDPKIKDAHLKWEMPGGTNEFGESPKDTLKREVLEETGLNVEVLDLLPECESRRWEHEDYHLHSLVMCYKCRLINGELNTSDPKIKDLRWVHPSKVYDFDLLPSAKTFFDLYNQLK